VIDLHGYFRKALAAKPANLKLTGDGVHMNLVGDAIMAFGVLRALGVSDAAIIATAPQEFFQFGPLRMSLPKAAELFEVPVTRFFKPELARLLNY
jgi:hypothetical protein